MPLCSACGHDNPPGEATLRRGLALAQQTGSAAIEPFLTKGETMKDLTIADVTRLGQLMTAVSNNCTSDEASAFFSRDDVTAFISG